MKKRQIEEEYKKINYEMFNNRPAITPYPPNVVKRRELLLYAQVHLAEISWAKKCKESETEKLHTETYNLVMSKYYGWEK